MEQSRAAWRLEFVYRLNEAELKRFLRRYCDISVNRSDPRIPHTGQPRLSPQKKPLH